MLDSNLFTPNIMFYVYEPTKHDGIIPVSSYMGLNILMNNIIQIFVFNDRIIR